MTEHRLITLLTDFGLSDIYVGVLKGTISSIDRALSVIDLTHEIPPQNLRAARFCLMSAWEYFPAGTVHVAVVDPGVGSSRRAVAIEFAGGFLVGPDNGLFRGVLGQSRAIAAVELTQPRYWRTFTPSTTFHGRDIFAPVGAHLAVGVSFSELGTPIDPESLVQLSLPELTKNDEYVAGGVQYCDRFGNLVTDIPGDWVGGKVRSAKLGDRTIRGVCTYSEGQPGELVALVGSHGWVEISVNGGSARKVVSFDEEVEVVVAIE
ncbi:SAM-dependent chlorinase/fluorinase [Oscillatoriales cyanobacterium LEGE 11467]|uniref:SAM-dependent chlorinase/fluorinase n=1 Tax=Zarconia navalis LEGE 11467 TaxID=1828826 RepID=A0A928Z7R2_9CYAN|nr:SAM-dependent chlorinase/fluorinase [Zarconia navalis]MBE9041692.1 SAM-dependent chlorinase/fluorinase [Zarconia navalis LEGE 11467]